MTWKIHGIKHELNAMFNKCGALMDAMTKLPPQA